MPKFSLGGRAFDAGLAALAALSAGFVAFAMPESLFSSLIEATPLPRLVAAAQPPLGDTARFIVVGASALVTFAAIWALMAALDRFPARRSPAVAPDAEAPRLRRADAHPDAPARRPLFAVRDLGEPLELEELAEPPAAEAPAEEAGHRPLPAFLIPQGETPAPEPQAEAQPEPEAAPEPEPEPEPEARSDPEPPALSELAAQLPEAGSRTDQSLSQLVNRIEFGLSRKRQAIPAAEAPPAEAAPAEGVPAEPERVGHRLRSAINDLQKIASGGA
jgi:hypothetical protein